MKLHLLIILTCLCVAFVNCQRTRTQNIAESEAPTQPRKVRGRVRFSLPIDVDAELADIPSKAIRPESRFEPRIHSRSEPNVESTRIESRPAAIVRKTKITTPRTSLYEVEEVVDDIPDKNLRKVHKSRVITETRFEAANAPKKPFFEPFPRPADEFTTDDIYAKFSPEITKSTTEKIVEKKKELIEESIEQKEVKKSKNNLKEETVNEEKTTLNEETITLSKEIEEDFNVSSSKIPESTTSSEISSTENEVKQTTASLDNDTKKLRTSRTRVQTSQTPSVDETTSKVRGRGRSRPAAPTQAPQSTQENNFQRSRPRGRGASTSSESSEIPSRGKTSAENEAPSRASRFRTTRRKIESSEETSSPRGRGSAFSETSQERESPPRTRTGRKVNYPITDNVPGQSEDTIFTIKPRRPQNSAKSEEIPKVTSRGRSRGQQKSIEITEAPPKTNSRRNPSRRRIEPIPSISKKTELSSSTPPTTTSTASTTTTTTTQTSSTSSERNLRRNTNQRLPSRSESTSTPIPSPSRNFRGRNSQKINLNDVEKKVVPTERKPLSRQRSRFIPPIIDEQKLEVLPLFESEAKTVEPIIKKRPIEIKSKSSNEIIAAVKPQIKEKIEIVTSKPLVKETVETKISEVVSTRRVVRPILRKRKKSKDGKINNESKKISRGDKKVELEKNLNADDIDDSDNYPAAFKALLHAKSKESSRTRSSEAVNTKKANIEKVVTAQRFATGTSSSSSSTSTTKTPLQTVKSTPKGNEDDNNIVPSTTASTTRGTRRKFSLATKPPGYEDNQPAKSTKRPNSNGRKLKIIRSTVAPSQVSVVTEVSQSVQTQQPRYHARFVASSTTDGAANLVLDEISSTTSRIKPKSSRGLYSSRKENGKRKEKKGDGSNQQQLAAIGKKKNRYSARFRNDIINRPASTRPTNAPVYIPTVPTVTPSYVKQRIEDGMEIISIDEPVNTIPSDNLINGELLTPSNLPEKLLPASLVTTGAPPAQPSEKQPVSIIERIIYSITAISSTVAPNQTADKTDDGPTKETAIFKIPSKKDQTKQTTDKTNENLTATTEKPTTIIERILSSINAIQSTSSPTVGISTVSSTARTPSSTITNTLGVIEELSNEQTDQQRTISQLLAILKSISPTPSTDLVVVTPKTTFSSTSSTPTTSDSINSISTTSASTTSTTTTIISTTSAPTSTSTQTTTSSSTSSVTSSINPDAEIINLNGNSIESENFESSTSSSTESSFEVSSESSTETSTTSSFSNTLDSSTVRSKTGFTETISLSDFLATLNYLNAISPTTPPNFTDGITKVPNLANSKQTNPPNNELNIENTTPVQTVENLIGQTTESVSDTSSDSSPTEVAKLEMLSISTENSEIPNTSVAEEIKVDFTTQVIESSSSLKILESVTEQISSVISSEQIGSTEQIQSSSESSSVQSITEEIKNDNVQSVTDSSIKLAKKLEISERIESDTPQMSLSTEMSQSTEMLQSTEMSQSTEMPQSTEMSQSSEIPLNSESPQNTEVTQSSEMPSSSETPQSTEMSQNSENPSSSETLQSTEMSQPSSSEVPQTSLVPQMSDRIQNSESSQLSETSEQPQIPQTTETLNKIETSEVPQSSELPETSETSEISQTTELLNKAETTEVPKNSEISQTSENPETTPIMNELNIATTEVSSEMAESSSQAVESVTEVMETTESMTTEMIGETETQNSLPVNESESIISAIKQNGVPNSSTILQLIARLLEIAGTTPNTISSTVTLEKTTVKPAGSSLSTHTNFEVSPGSVTVFSANDVTSTFNQPDDGSTITISSRTFAASKANRIMTDVNNSTNNNSSMDVMASVTNETSSSNETSSISNDTNSSMTISNSTNTNNNATNREAKLLASDPQPIENNTIETSTAPDKDYYIFAILPNNTIIRKRPSMYPNKNTPFIIVGVYPNNTVVQKFPNGTLIPEEPIIQVSGFDVSANPQTPRPDITSNQVTQDSTRSDDNNQTLQTATKNDLPSTPEIASTQAPTGNMTIINRTIEEFDDIPKSNVNATNETVANTGRDTEEVNIEENTISNNGNNKPEKIVEATNVETTTKKKEDITTAPPKPQQVEIITIPPKQSVPTTLPPTTMNVVTTIPTKKETIIVAKTIPPEFNFVENDIQETTTQRKMMTTTRYTNTPTTVTPIFEDYQLNIRATTPYFIQRIFSNFTALGSRLGEEITTITELVTTQRITTIPTTKPVQTTTTQVPTTTRTVPTTTRTVPTTTRTVPTTTRTVPTTTRPVPTTTRPVPTTTKPVPTTTKPIPTTTRPIRTTTIPLPTTTNPPPTIPPRTPTKPPLTTRFMTTTKRFVTTTPFFVPETTFWTTTRRIRTAAPTTTERITTTPRRTTRPTTKPTEPPTTTIRQTTTKRRSGRFRNTTPQDLIRTVTVTPSTQTTELPQTEKPTKRTTFYVNTIPTEPVRYEETTIFPIYTTQKAQETTLFTGTSRPITKTPTTPAPVTLSVEDELRRLAELRVLENFGELSTTNDFVSTTTVMTPTTLQATLKGVNAKVKTLTEQQRKDLQELARLEKEQAEILRQLAFLTRFNFGGTTQKPTRSPSNLASRVLEFATDRDKATTTENPLDILSALTNAGEPKKVPPGTKDVSLDDLLRQFNVSPERVTPSNLVSTYGESTDAILAALLKEQGIGPSTPKTLGEQLKTTIPVQIPTTRPTKKVTTTRKRITTTTPRPGPIMQGLNWLLNMLAPPPTTKRPVKKKVTTTERISTVDDLDLYSSQPTEMTPVVVTAPKRSPPNPATTRGARKYKRPLHALSENELSSLISQLEEAQKDPKKAQNLDLSDYDLSQTTRKPTTLLHNNAVQITNSGKVGSTSKLQAASSVESEVVYRRKPTTPLPSTVSNSIAEDEEYVDPVTKPPRRPTLRPVVLNPVPGIDDGEGETRVRGQLLSAAVNVTRAISQFLGSAIQRAGQSFQSLIGAGSRQVGNFFASSSSANG
ncbi:mucin-2-like isoform X2 [Onthophagus taurus]|uniref:mucin-2-like isoform X2 n=1 Tax=Onthophagus taurus TaxID=166361 RepID=UPI0039BE9602